MIRLWGAYRFALVCCLFLAAGIAGTVVAREEPQSYSRVLVLHSYHDGFTWSDNLSAGIREAFAGQALQVELSFEYMDARRLYSAEYFKELQTVYRFKYADRTPDVVIACDDYALSFMTTLGQEIFPHVPVIFCSATGYTPDMREGRKLTGLRESVDLHSTLDVALKLHPDTTRIAVILDSSRTGRALKAKSEETFKDYPELRVTYLEDLTIKQLRERLATLADDTLVLVYIFRSEASGRVLPHEQNLKRVAPYCPVPIYGVWEFYLGHGIVGGKLTNGKLEGRMVGTMARRVLRGEDAALIPVGTSPTVYMFDYRQLERFDVDRALLPPDSIVINEPFSFYQTYRSLIWSVVAVIVVLVALIAYLIFNIVHRKRAQEALLRSEARYRSLTDDVLDNSQVAINIIGPSFSIVWMNKAMERYFGVSRAEIIGQDIRQLVRGQLSRVQEDPDDFIQRITATYESSEAVSTFECHIAGNDEVDERWLEHRSQPIQAGIYAGGRIEQYYGITDRKLAEQQRRSLEAQMLHTQKLESLGVLAGGIAHDFNNVLTSIIGNTDLVQLELPKDSSAQVLLEDVQASALRAADLCQQMLAYSGKGRFVTEVVDLRREIKEIAQMLRVSISKKTELKFDFAPATAPIRADVTQVRQVLMNLITNASESHGSGSGTVKISTGVMDCDARYLSEPYLEDDLAPGRYTFVDVEDQGCGMDEETQARIFDPFFSTKFTGRGLGMAAVLGIVRGHHGAIKVSSRLMEGTRMRVLFPVADGGTAVNGEDPEKVATAWRGSGTALLVDDEEVVRAIGSRILQKLGFSVVVASDGHEALEQFQQYRDDIRCVILDLTMPKMDGEECFRELRRLDQDIPIIMASGYNEQEIAVRNVCIGMAGFIHKPFKIVTLRDVLARALGS